MVTKMLTFISRNQIYLQIFLLLKKLTHTVDHRKVLSNIINSQSKAVCMTQSD